MGLKHSGQAAINLAVYEQNRSVLEYVEGRTDLLLAEQAVLARLEKEIRGAAVLDIGIGSGRTTAVMLELTSDYVGIDFSEAMIAASRARFPGTKLLQCDARQMQDLGDARYGFVWFSFNGIDSVSHDERHDVIKQVFKLLKPGGIFYFSSHNITAPVEKPWQLRLYDWSWRPAKLIECLDKLLRGSVNHWKRRPLHVRTDRYVIQTDSAHEFACLHYYVDPAYQVLSLREIGFVDVETMGWRGQPFPTSHERIKGATHVHYLARKPK